jgi:hypothetical protein
MKDLKGTENSMTIQFHEKETILLLEKEIKIIISNLHSLLLMRMILKYSINKKNHIEMNHKELLSYSQS